MEYVLETRYTQFLEHHLTPSRYQHSLGVMQVMADLAGIYALDRKKAVLAGYLHDAGKDLEPAQQQQIIEEASIEIFTPCDRDYVLYLHGPVGAYLVHKELGITDPLILDAISMHAFYGAGENFNSPLVWCLRFADLLEMNRGGWSGPPAFREGRDPLRKMVYDGRLWESALFQTSLLIELFEGKGFPVHPNMKQVYKELSSQFPTTFS